MRTTTFPIVLALAAGIAVLSPAAVRGQNYTGFSLAICQDGSVHSFGQNGICQLGIGTSGGTHYLQEPVGGLSGAVAVAIGYEHALALTDQGTVYAWGSNYQGCCAQDPSTYSSLCAPMEVDLPGCATAISAGVNFSLALLADGTVWAWGIDTYGQLGNDASATSSYVPVQVSGISTAIAISAGAEFGLALLANGKMKSWGRNGNGELGDNTTTDRYTPVTVKTSTGDLTHVQDIDAGGNHSVVLKDNGQVWVWGLNTDGQLCQSNYTSSSVAIQASGLYSTLTTEIDVAASVKGTMVLNSNGTTRVCGNNASYQLGISGAGPFNTVQAGPNLTGAIDITMPSSAKHGLAVMSNGDLYT